MRRLTIRSLGWKREPVSGIEEKNLGGVEGRGNRIRGFRGRGGLHVSNDGGVPQDRGRAHSEVNDSEEEQCGLHARGTAGNMRIVFVNEAAGVMWKNRGLLGLVELFDAV